MATMTKEQAEKLFRLDEATGELLWRAHPSPRHQHLVGRPAAYLKRGQRFVHFERKAFRVDHIAWLMLFGEWPVRAAREKPVESLADLDLSGFTL